MKFELLKSILLTILVAISIFLTWSLWTYQPNYEFIDQKDVHEISISNNQRDISQLIKPTRVLYHLDNKEYGTTNKSIINLLLKEASTWNYYEVETTKISRNEQIQELMDADNRVILIYPDDVPFEIFKGVLQIQTNNVADETFNRIVVPLKAESKNGSSVYFISTDESKVYETHINPEQLNAIRTNVKNNKGLYDEYTALELKGDQVVKYIYVPKKQKKISTYKYYSEVIDPEKFKKALFRNPSKVRKAISSTGEQYADDTSLMNVDYLSNTLFYVNPGQEAATGLNEDNKNVLERSIEYVNEHGGWTDHYQYFSMSEFEQKIVFRLFMNGLPVFNEQGMSEIRQTWGNEEIFQYKRPYFSLDIPLQEKKEVILPSGEEALDLLLENKEFNIALLQDMVIGYRMSMDSINKKIVTLEPSWYYLYGGSWLRLSPEEMRGDKHGLE